MYPTQTHLIINATYNNDHYNNIVAPMMPSIHLSIFAQSQIQIEKQISESTQMK